MLKIELNEREELSEYGGSGKVKDMQRRNIIVRLEKCRNKNKEFYNKHPDLLKELDYKIEALKNGVDYKINDANWTVAYIGGKLRDANTGFKETNRGLIEYKNTMTIEIAKEVYSKLRENPHFKNRK